MQSLGRLPKNDLRIFRQPKEIAGFWDFNFVFLVPSQVVFLQGVWYLYLRVSWSLKPRLEWGGDSYRRPRSWPSPNGTQAVSGVQQGLHLFLPLETAKQQALPPFDWVQVHMSPKWPAMRLHILRFVQVLRSYAWSSQRKSF